jgi:hypothetical protein
MSEIYVQDAEQTIYFYITRVARAPGQIFEAPSYSDLPYNATAKCKICSKVLENVHASLYGRCQHMLTAHKISPLEDPITTNPLGTLAAHRKYLSQFSGAEI